MRVSLSMLRRLSAGILVSFVVLLAACPVFAADTGTYKIDDYIVTLEPQHDGRVLITVEQQWQVLGGHIPWVTVGLPNKYFEIKDFSGDTADVSDGSGSGFYGVRVDLDEDYRPGETFNIKFTVLQGHILERLTSENKWRIDYTPGWYDNGAIGRLRVDLISPVEYQTYVTANPPPVVNGNIISWERTDLNPGARLDILIESTDGTFLTADEPDTGGGLKLGSGFWWVVGIIVVVGLFIFWRISQGKKEREAYIRRKATSIEEEMAKDVKKKEAIEEDFKEYVEKKGLRPDEQGRYYDRSYGNYITPAIWWAIIASQNRNAINPPTSGSCVNRPGCACACVSCACACACACAGGGAAGCSRKTLHEFKISEKSNGKINPGNKTLHKQEG